MQALVTGATGFVGQALCLRLRALGKPVRGLVREGRSTGPLQAAGVDIHHGGIADPNTIADAARDCDVVFHCASESSPHAAPEALAWINVAGTENVLRAARHAGVAQVVMLSCVDVSLCNRDRVHWKEDAVLSHAPLGAYARNRLLADELALQSSDASLAVTTLRPAFLWGPGDHTNLPGLCAEASAGGVRLFGSGDNFFATTYIDNLIEAMIAVSHTPGIGGQAFHIGDAEIYTAREFFTKLSTTLALPKPRKSIYALAYAAAQIRRSLGANGPWPEDIARRARPLLLDCLRAINAFDYRPKVDLEQGMQALATWVNEVGGPEKIRQMARPPATQSDALHHQKTANALTPPP